MFFNSPSLRRNFKSIASHVLWIFVVGYFIFHIFTGARGAVSRVRLSQGIAVMEKELKDLKEENEFLENKIKLIRSDNLDLDLLEEQAMSVLGFARKGDIIALLPRDS